MDSVKPDTVDTVDTTQGGTPAHAGGSTATRVFKLRVVYAGSVGIIKADAYLWDGKEPLGIGRRSESRPTGPWLRVEDTRASREHARLYTDGSRTLIEDLHSRNGTAINGELLDVRKPHPLHDGDVIRIADSFVFFRCEPEAVSDAPISAVVGVSQAACQIRCAIASLLLSERTLLILGETGTGKDVVAETIHRLSQRSGKLVAVNCAAVPATLAEAQLFGVKRGAFTGAIPQPGFFGEAEKGTLFLDEVGDLPLELQPKLLRVLQTREIVPVGSSQPVACDVRVVAATNRDLTAAIAEQNFRADLYARLSREVIKLPPLRERREDILLLAQHFGTTDCRPSPRLVAAMLAYDWPLNVREIDNLVGRLRTIGEPEILEALSAWQGPDGKTAAGKSNDGSLLRKAAVPPSHAELLELLQQYRGNLRRIAAKSGYSRRQLARLADKYNLDINTYRK
jgi:transcriptional regulator with AAA-type ATPase domain